MLTSLKLQGFQSHLNSTLEFGDGVTVLVGPSRNGKTCVLRAIKWLAENRPVGIDGFITHGQKEVSVTLELDGRTITRRKNSKENVYILDGEKFSGIGTEVPRPIKELLNLSELNTADQFDVPFLLFDSPGQVARTLNAIVHLEKIDAALANIVSLKRQNDQDIRTQDARVKELIELESSFPDLEAAEEFIAELEKQQTEMNEKESLKSGLQLLQTNLDSCRYNLAITKIPDELQWRVVDLEATQIHKTQLEYTADSLQSLQSKLAIARLDIIRLTPAVEQETLVSLLIAKNQILSGKRKALNKLRTYETSLNHNKDELSAKSAIIKTGELKFKEMFPERCPLCGK
jgi:exonuclease SbcC